MIINQSINKIYRLVYLRIDTISSEMLTAAFSSVEKRNKNVL